MFMLRKMKTLKIQNDEEYNIFDEINDEKEQDHSKMKK